MAKLQAHFVLSMKKWRVYDPEHEEQTVAYVDSLEEFYRHQLYDLCDETETSKAGIDYLVNYYINSLGWSEKQALKYAIELFENGTIEQIKFIGKDGDEI